MLRLWLFRICSKRNTAEVGLNLILAKSLVVILRSPVFEHWTLWPIREIFLAVLTSPCLFATCFFLVLQTHLRPCAASCKLYGPRNCGSKHGAKSFNFEVLDVEAI